MHTKKIAFTLLNTLLIAGTLGALGYEVKLLSGPLPQAIAQEDPAADPAAAGDAAPADGQADAADAPVNPADQKCKDRLQEFMDSKKVEFGEFINEHFRSPQPTSILIPVAIERLRQYRVDVRKKNAEYFPAQGSSTSQAGGQSSSCEEAMNNDFTIMKELLRQHIVSNAYAKKATRLLDAYKALNSKLEKLNFTVAEMYGYFGAFSQKLPCFATKCVKG